MKRPTHAMPEDVTIALKQSGTRGDYDARPHYQRNDYIGWIDRAKTAETRLKRVSQMINELKQGGVYMGMTHAPSRKTD
jgi:uncharacterized protein YdeI (YjbR/CyaY-like superfamily)